MTSRDLISIHDLAREEVLEILDLASRIKANPREHRTALEGKTLAMVFEKPSLRTRVSFETGMTQLGGHAIAIQGGEVGLGKREAIGDVAHTLEGMVDGIMARTFSHQLLIDMAAAASVPVINGLSDHLHPCQALADYLTIREKKGKLEGLTLGWLGDGNNVLHSLMYAGAKLGVNVQAACPEGYDPDAGVVARAQADAKATGVKITVGRDPIAALKGADVIYTDTWASMGQEAEHAARVKVFRPYQVNAAAMAKANPGALFMHCLPAHRNEEVTDEVIDSKASVVFPQAHNRLHAQKAVMALLMGAKG
ncbi:MAG TPA: ornithine carbamoyltransferase [Verrucomicrobiae bacterium]|nr:ornithine carbamoyltransferase [Verrucomicrobiae bacterium]